MPAGNLRSWKLLSHDFYINLQSSCHNILRHFNVFLNFPYTKVKQSVIISNKHGIYKLPDKDLRKHQENSKTS